MPKALKKTLPKDFDALLEAGDAEALKAALALCEPDARGGYSKQTAIAFDRLPETLTRWLVSEGANIDARDQYERTPLYAHAFSRRGNPQVLLELGADVSARDYHGDTPLHAAATRGNLETARLLLAHGARADALNNRGQTPLVAALERCQNADIADLAPVAELLLDAMPAPQPGGLRALAGRLFGGAKAPNAKAPGKTPVTAEMKAFVTRIGTDFEFYRSAFNADLLPATEAALQRLYVLFGVPPVPPRLQHDGRTAIRATAARWQERHQELWALLVPPQGAAQTVQGEVIRIAGRIGDEIDRNGGANWDGAYRQMAKALLAHIASGNPLRAADQERAARAVAEIRTREGATGELCEIAVDWVALNPEPTALAKPEYDR